MGFKRPEVQIFSPRPPLKKPIRKYRFFLLCRVRRPLELRDAAALPCYSVALLLTNLLTQTTFEETDTFVSVFLLCRVRSPLELLETVFYNEKAPIARCFCFGLGFAYLPRTTYFVCNTSCALWLLGLSK